MGTTWRMGLALLAYDGVCSYFFTARVRSKDVVQLYQAAAAVMLLALCEVWILNITFDCNHVTQLL